MPTGATSPISPPISTRPAAASPAADSDALRAHLGRLAKRGLAAASVARRLSAIRQLYRFLYSEGHRGDDPAAVIEGPKRGRSLPKVLTIKQVDDLLAQAREGVKAEAKSERLRAARLNCLLEVLYATGLRVSELVALPEAAARRDQRMLVIRGKGGRERLVPLNDQAKRTMTDYLALRAEAEARQVQMAVPLVRRKRASEPPAFRPRAESARRRRGPEGRAGQPACAAPRLRQPPAAERRRPARGADAARPCRHLDHADLHACAGGAAQEPGARPAPAGGGGRE